MIMIVTMLWWLFSDNQVFAASTDTQMEKDQWVQALTIACSMVERSMSSADASLDRHLDATGHQDSFLASCEGYIHKRNSQKRLGAWKQRYAVLNGTIMSVYPTKEVYLEKMQEHQTRLTDLHRKGLRGGVVQGVYKLVHWDCWGGREYGFRFETKDTQYDAYCNTHDDYTRWAHSLSSALGVGPATDVQSDDQFMFSDAAVVDDGGTDTATETRRTAQSFTRLYGTYAKPDAANKSHTRGGSQPRPATVEEIIDEDDIGDDDDPIEL